MNSLPVFHMHHRKACMTGNIFIKWFQNQFALEVRKFSEENDLQPRALFLVVDNTISHPSDGELVCVELKAIFLPTNATLLLDPMDQRLLQLMNFAYKNCFNEI